MYAANQSQEITLHVSRIGGKFSVALVWGSVRQICIICKWGKSCPLIGQGALSLISCTVRGLKTWLSLSDLGPLYKREFKLLRKRWSAIVTIYWYIESESESRFGSGSGVGSSLKVSIFIFFLIIDLITMKCMDGPNTRSGLGLL